MPSEKLSVETGDLLYRADHEVWPEGNAILNNMRFQTGRVVRVSLSGAVILEVLDSGIPKRGLVPGTYVTVGPEYIVACYFEKVAQPRQLPPPAHLARMSWIPRLPRRP